MESESESAMVCASGGRPPRNPINQMKLFTSIAAAAAIGASFVAAAPVEAGNGWIHAGTSVKNNSIYVRPLSRNGNFVTYERSLSGDESRFIANCPAWQYKSLKGSKWIDVMPNSIGAAAHRTVCSANVTDFDNAFQPSSPVNTPSRRPTTSTTNNSDSAVQLVYKVVNDMSNGDSYSARESMAGAALSNYDPSFFKQFNRVTVSNLKITGDTGGNYDLSGKMTYVYKDGTIQTEERSFTVASIGSNPRLMSTEFVRVIKAR